jgi:predicted ATPase
MTPPMRRPGASFSCCARSWRFCDHFRADRESPARISRAGTRTFALAGDGADLAAALQTIIEIDDQPLNAAIDDAFAGSSIIIEETRGIFELCMHKHGLLRSLSVPSFQTARRVICCSPPR